MNLINTHPLLLAMSSTALSPLHKHNSLISPFRVVDSPGQRMAPRACHPHCKVRPSHGHQNHNCAAKKKKQRSDSPFTVSERNERLIHSLPSSFPHPKRTLPFEHSSTLHASPISFMAVSNCTSISGTDSALKNGVENVLQKKQWIINITHQELLLGCYNLPHSIHLMNHRSIFRFKFYSMMQSFKIS